MSISIVTPIYKDEQATDLNKGLEGLLTNWEIENEGISEYLSDLTLNHSERRVKTDAEITPSEQAEIAVLREHQNVLERKINELKSVLYSGYTETPLDEFNGEKKHRMNTQQMSEWLGKNVKPLILKGVVIQKAVATQLESTGPSILWRIKAVHGKSMDWKQYVKNVQNGIF